MNDEIIKLAQKIALRALEIELMDSYGDEDITIQEMREVIKKVEKQLTKSQE